MMYVLDSSILIELFEGRRLGSIVLERFPDEVLATTSLCIHEVLAGAQSEKDVLALEPLFSRFIVLDYNLSAARISSRIYRELRRSGTLINIIDILIAAICEEHGATIITLDNDFKKIRSLNTVFIE